MTYSIPADKLPELIQAVRDLATKYPDAEYFHDADICSYSTGKAVNGPDQCGCLIGQAMRLAGLPPVPPELDNRSIDNLIEGDWGGCLPSGSWLGTVQVKQDAGYPWGKAVKVADEKVNPQVPPPAKREEG